MGMIQSKPIEGRSLPNELLYETNKFMPLNGLIKCCQANSTLKDLGIPRARKVHEKLISLYFEDIFTLAIWFKQWARQLAELRANIHRHTQTFNRLTLDKAWTNVFRLNKRQFYNLLNQCCDKTKEIRNMHLADILVGFNFPPAFQNELRQIRASHIEEAFTPAKFELSQWHRSEMMAQFRGILEEDAFRELMRTNILNEYLVCTIRSIKLCEEELEMAAIHLNRRS